MPPSSGRARPCSLPHSVRSFRNLLRSLLQLGTYFGHRIASEGAFQLVMLMQGLAAYRLVEVEAIFFVDTGREWRIRRLRSLVGRALEIEVAGRAGALVVEVLAGSDERFPRGRSEERRVGKECRSRRSP